MMAKQDKLFGQILREKRMTKGYSLRKFAELIGVSPTYLSQVEQGNVDPPTAERVRNIAEILGENADEWIGLAGRVPDDLSKIIQDKPKQMPELLREVTGLTSEQVQQLIERARKFKGGGTGKNEA